jgi:hypothetical protein
MRPGIGESSSTQQLARDPLLERVEFDCGQVASLEDPGSAKSDRPRALQHLPL